MLSQGDIQDTQQSSADRIRELTNQKIALLDEYGVFGGGEDVNRKHQMINAELESLGVDPNS